MDEEMELEFNDKIMKALMKKVQDSNTRCDVLEKDLGVKQAELQYLAKLYDEETSALSQQLEEEKEKADNYERELNEIKAKLSKKDEELSNLTSKMEDFNSMKQEIKELRSQLEDSNKTINVQQSTLSQQEAKILEMGEEIKNKDIIIEEQTTLYQAAQMELKEYKGPEMIADDSSESDRLKCYKCGSVGKDIKVVEDKSKALSYVGNMPMYAKYHVCKKCGYQF